MTIKLLVADDHEVARKGVGAMLAGSDIQIVAEAADGTEAVKLAAKHKPEVVLMDVRMPGGTSLDALEQVLKASPKSRVVMWSTYHSPVYVAQAGCRGACDCILKGVGRQQLVTTLMAAAAGKCPIASGELHRVASLMASTVATVDADTRLSPRESQVLRHLALGLSNKEIGQSLSIKLDTVKEHVQHVLRKLAVTDRTQAAVWAVRKGVA